MFLTATSVKHSQCLNNYCVIEKKIMIKEKDGEYLHVLNVYGNTYITTHFIYATHTYILSALKAMFKL